MKTTATAFLALLLLSFSPGETPREGSGEHQKACEELEGKPAPEWDVQQWIIPLPEETEGKTRLIHFFGTWCTPARESIPLLKKLHETWSEKGLLIISIHTPLGAEALEDFLKENEITWPVALDRPASGTPLEAATAARFLADSVPDYFLIDHDGMLRHADIPNGAVEEAVRSLLEPSEAPPSDPPSEEPPSTDKEGEGEEKDPPSSDDPAPPAEE